MTDSPESTTRAEGREVTITRVFDAPRELVWKTWTEPEHFAHWFGSPPFTTPPDTVSMDVRPGGAWRATMVSEDDGSELPFQGVYREVVEPERLVMTFDDPSDPGNPNVEVLTVTFTDLGGRTEVVAHQAGHLPEDEYGRLAEGYSSFFDRLSEHLAEIGRSGA
jgi:uncharacterized protein YndB with AHSA1/START domain